MVVTVPRARHQTKCQILPVAVIGGGDDRQPSGLAEVVQSACEPVGEIDVLDDLQAEHERPLPEIGGQILVSRTLAEIQPGGTRVRDALFGGVDTRDLPTLCRQHPRCGTIAAAQVENSPSAAFGEPSLEKAVHGRHQIGMRACRIR